MAKHCQCVTQVRESTHNQTVTVFRRAAHLTSCDVDFCPRPRPLDCAKPCALDEVVLSDGHNEPAVGTRLTGLGISVRCRGLNVTLHSS